MFQSKSHYENWVNRLAEIYSLDPDSIRECVDLMEELGYVTKSKVGWTQVLALSTAEMREAV